MWGVKSIKNDMWYYGLRHSRILLISSKECGNINSDKKTIKILKKEDNILKECNLDIVTNSVIKSVQKNIKNSSIDLYISNEDINTMVEIYKNYSIVLFSDFMCKKSIDIISNISEKMKELGYPTLFITETELNYEVGIEFSINKIKKDFSDLNARFVSVICQPLIDGRAIGILAGNLANCEANVSISSTVRFPIYKHLPPNGWKNRHSRMLDESKFLTLRTYADLEGYYWYSTKTFSSDTSDYRYIEVVRTVFKAIRITKKLGKYNKNIDFKSIV